jgi:hypothetical protein
MARRPRASAVHERDSNAGGGVAAGDNPFGPRVRPARWAARAGVPGSWRLAGQPSSCRHRIGLACSRLRARRVGSRKCVGEPLAGRLDPLKLC